MHPSSVLDEFLVILAAACVVVPLFRRLRWSSMLGYLVAGMLIGPHGAAIIPDETATRVLGDFGVVFLLFAIGLELSITRLSVMRVTVFGLGSAQVAATAAAGWAVARALGLDNSQAAILGGGLALSSTAMVLQSLVERGEMTARHGRVAFSVLLLQDLAVVPLLTLIPLLGPGGGASLPAALGLALGKALVALVVIVVAGRVVVRPVLRMVAEARQPELFTTVTLLVVLGVGWMTERAGLSMALGAFLAGLLIAETEYRHQVEADVEPFRGVLLALFFMSVGMSINLGLIFGQIPLVLALVGVVVAIKSGILALLCRLFGFPVGVSAQVGLELAQGGEFAFVVFVLAIQHHVLPGITGQLALALVALTMALTPALSAAGRRVAARLKPPPLPGIEAITRESGDLKNHVVIAGFGRVGQTLARLLEAHKQPYIALDLEPLRVAEGRARGLPVYYGDASRAEVLRAAGSARARAAVVTLDHPEAAQRAVLALRGAWPELPVLVRARDLAHRDGLEQAGATLVVPEMVEASLHLGGVLLNTVGTPPDQVARALDRFRDQAYARLDDLIPAKPPGDDMAA
ncbi:MAG: potassium transporter KefB [Azospirillum sp.]|nr:potassium transporter KefB [Azospirillum sp.]